MSVPWPPVYTGPVDQHPATARLRKHIEALESLPPTKERDEALAYARRELRRFEWGVYDFRAQAFLRD